ncbi:MAG: Holliday junction branch migration protein RuvA [Pseudohongiellaceae bacterium]
MVIGRIRGTLLEKHLTEVLVEVNGIAYEIQVPMSTLYRLPEPGQSLQLHTHFVVREDAQLLYGFADIKEKDLFRALIKVNGVGPRIALAILSGMAVDDFVVTVNNNDVATLVKMPGVGRKTAERLIIEMRDRLKDWSGSATVYSGLNTGTGAESRSREAEAALQTLGYKPQEASRAVNRVLREFPDAKDSESIIRLALKRMV